MATDDPDLAPWDDEAPENPPERPDNVDDMFGAPDPAPASAAPPAAPAGDSPAYTVLARKYRPRAFADMIGQEAMVRTLRNAFATGRIAHAFMLTGVRGVGRAEHVIDIVRPFGRVLRRLIVPRR